MESYERWGEMEHTKHLKAGNRKDAIIRLGSLKWGQIQDKKEGKEFGTDILGMLGRLFSGMKVQRAQTGGDVAIWMPNMVGWR